MGVVGGIADAAEKGRQQQHDKLQALSKQVEQLSGVVN